MDDVSLKEHIEAILLEKDKALTAALIAVKEENRKTEIAAEKRFELLNELRSGVATKGEMEAIDKGVIELKLWRSNVEGKQSRNQLIAIVSTIIALISLVLTFFK